MDVVPRPRPSRGNHGKAIQTCAPTHMREARLLQHRRPQLEVVVPAAMLCCCCAPPASNHHPHCTLLLMLVLLFLLLLLMLHQAHTDDLPEQPRHEPVLVQDELEMTTWCGMLSAPCCLVKGFGQ